MAAKKRKKSVPRVKSLPVKTVQARQSKDVRGGLESTKHPSKITVPDA